MAKRLTVWLGAAALAAIAGMAQGAGAEKTLDRTGLIRLADDYFAALVAHDPGKVPLASDVTEKEYKILNDPGRDVSAMNFNPFDLPALHIYKIWGGQIHEIEAIGFTAPYNSQTGWE